MIKKLSALLLALCVLALCGCARVDDAPATPREEKVTLTMWAYGTGGSEEDLRALLQKFTDTHPLIKIDLTMLEENDQSMVSASIESGSGPDLMLGDIRQLQHARHAGATCVDLTDLLHKDVYNTVTDACVLDDGTLFALPVAMDVTTMAINYEMFEAAGALQYIDPETHTWTTENFFAAIDALLNADVPPTGLLFYCGGQNGDGRFLHTLSGRYTPDSPAMREALIQLLANEEILFDADLVGSDENLLFLHEQVGISLYWGADHAQPDNFTAFPMAYPTAEGASRLPVEIWGVSLHDLGDEAHVAAGQKLLTYLTGTAQSTRNFARTLGHYPVRYMSGFDGTEAVYNELMTLAGNYERAAYGYAVARTEWYEMLQRLSEGAVVENETFTCALNANAAAQAVQ